MVYEGAWVTSTYVSSNFSLESQCLGEMAFTRAEPAMSTTGALRALGAHGLATVSPSMSQPCVNLGLFRESQSRYALHLGTAAVFASPLIQVACSLDALDYATPVPRPYAMPSQGLHPKLAESRLVGLIVQVPLNTSDSWYPVGVRAGHTLCLGQQSS